MTDVKFTLFPDYINWVDGEADGTPFMAKLYDDPSVLGINEGRVSKLYLQGVNYDRGWDYGEDHPLVAPIVDFLEQAPRRFDGPQERVPATELYARHRKDREERGLFGS